METKRPFRAIILFTTAVFVSVCSSLSLAQHRGDNLNFQGTDFVNRNGVKAQAMGGAFTSISGELDALFWNPAGLVGISGVKFSANFNSSNQLWRESQDYRPNRQLVTMSFILDGLLVPNPDFNGFLNDEAFLQDSTFRLDDPLLGKNSFSEEAADWQKELDDSGLNNVAAALPFTFAGKHFVISGGYTRQISTTNYDRNQTNLDPHIAFNGYGDLPDRVTGAGDSVRVNWSDYERLRTGPLRNISAALAVGLNDQVSVGIGLNRLSGETDEFQSLSRIGTFDLVQGIQIFRFSYDTLDVRTETKSDFSATSINLGAILKLGKLSVGANVTPAHTINRKWRGVTITSDAKGSNSQPVSGKDELKMPSSYSFGASVNPHNRVRIAFDLEYRPYTDAKFELAQADSTLRSWADQTSIRAGIEYKAFKNLALLAGYRNIPQVFIPDGAAASQRGPEVESYTLGASLKVRGLRFDAAYEVATLKYFDVYFSNTNFAYERFNNLAVGVTLTY